MIQITAMRTHTGQPIVYANPSHTVVLWEDLTAGLTRQRRYAGHLDWTIAQHLALCTILARHWGYSDRLVALCAAHDLHEAYTLDLPKGLKECLPGYVAIEDAWELHVHQSLGLQVLPDDITPIKAVDVRVLAIEMLSLGWEEWEPAQQVALHTGGPRTDDERLMFSAARNLPMVQVRAAVEQV